MNAARIDQRIPGAIRSCVGGAAERVAVGVKWSVGGRDGVPVAEVIDRSLVSRELLAMIVGRVRNQLSGTQVPLDLQRGKIVGIRAAHAFGGRRIEVPLPRVRVGRPEG